MSMPPQLVETGCLSTDTRLKRDKERQVKTATKTPARGNGNREYKRRKKKEDRIILGGKRVTRMVTAINNVATYHKPLLNRKRSAISAASKEGTTSPKQLKRPEPQKKRKGADETPRVNKRQKTIKQNHPSLL